MISHIAAVSKNGVIGNKGELPWHLPEDLKYFKAKTLNRAIIMGRKTFESLGKPLPKRLNIVVSRDPDYQAEGCRSFTSVQDAIAFCKDSREWSEEIFIVGGGEIYKHTLDMADRLYLTLIDKEFNGDARYPDWNKDFKLVSEDKRSENGVDYSFCIFEPK
ncbi:MAG: dihydrofolate reductase [Bdellovibrionales bacterium]|nr:dihydrofolate reductase [Bdellovibrionales bacterium]